MDTQIFNAVKTAAPILLIVLALNSPVALGQSPGQPSQAITVAKKKKKKKKKDPKLKVKIKSVSHPAQGVPGPRGLPGANGPSGAPGPTGERGSAGMIAHPYIDWSGDDGDPATWLALRTAREIRDVPFGTHNNFTTTTSATISLHGTVLLVGLDPLAGATPTTAGCQLLLNRYGTTGTTTIPIGRVPIAQINPGGKTANLAVTGSTDIDPGNYGIRLACFAQDPMSAGIANGGVEGLVFHPE